MPENICLVIGGCGFLGSYAVQSLLKAGYKVRVFDRVEAGKHNLKRFESQIDYVFGDLVNEKDIQKALDGVQTVFHFAYTTVPKTAAENPVFDVQTNVVPLIKLLEAMTRQIQKPKIVYCSSGGAVYGPQGVDPIVENSVPGPISAYGNSKLSCERYLKLFHHLHGLEYVILRMSNPFGPRQDPNKPQGAIITFLSQIKKQKTIEVWGDGSVVRDYFYVEDLLGLLSTIPEIKGSGTYNVGMGVGHSINQVLETIRTTVGFDFQVEFVEAQKHDTPVNVLNTEKIRNTLDWSCRTSLSEGIHSTWKWVEKALLVHDTNVTQRKCVLENPQ